MNRHRKDQVSDEFAPWWKKLGPGLITGAADDDPSGIATYSQGGAQFGYNVLWSVILTFPLMVGIQLASARVGRVTGKGLAENFRLICPAWVVALLVGLLTLANVINLGADLNAMGDVAALALGGTEVWYAAGFGVSSLVALILVPYRRYVTVLKWLTLTLLAYVGVAFTVRLDWTDVLRSAVWPHVTWSKDYATTIVAILGTTISPYLFFWQAAEEVEEIRRLRADQPLWRAPQQARAQFRRLKIDTMVGMGFSNAIAFFMIVATAATLHVHGVSAIASTTQAAEALRPIAGEAGFFLFALGIVGTGLLAVPVLGGSAAYAISSVFRWRMGLDRSFGRARPFYLVIAAAILLGIAISAADLDAMLTLYWSAVINALISVPIMVVLMMVASSRKVMGDFTLSWRGKFLGWAATLAMACATGVMLWSFVAA